MDRRLTKFEFWIVVLAYGISAAISIGTLIYFAVRCCQTMGVPA